ncbi:MAG TPA: DUF433 domain-containing protein [Pyrinomonadaceae bacterium]|nr:DUF433 domain-containing protein [Pyrinomonadaceae bacterium]HMP64751.1 DUF433 domain-containing protein [Pyrinomonadaceae bacterium]
MSVATLNNHITLNEEGFPIVRGTKTKVIQIVMDVMAHGWNADEIHEQYPYLSLAQIHSALAYYYDHRKELDADIERRQKSVDQIFREIGPSKLRDKVLKKRGLK